MSERQNGTLEGWSGGWWAALCEICDWRFLLPAGRQPERCPHCMQRTLTPLERELSQLPYLRPPGVVVPATVSTGRLQAGVEQFAANIPYPPEDLTAERLRARLQLMALPLWLVDVEVHAGWRAEMGFDYEVVSHQSSYDDRGGGWREREVKEGRVRWEPRLGRLHRTYRRIVAPALEEERDLERRLGRFDLRAAHPPQADVLQNSLVYLPNQTPEAAWPAAEPHVHHAAAEECRQAAVADHIRDFRWRPDYPERQWTLMLRLIYATFYLDDEGQPQAILIHGQTGQVSGRRRGSMRRAQRRALIIGSVAAVIFLLSLILGVASVAAPPLLFLAGIGILLALVIGAGALVPIIRVWQFNRQEEERANGSLTERGARG